MTLIADILLGSGKLREAFEEVGLPLEAKLVHLVTLPYIHPSKLRR